MGYCISKLKINVHGDCKLILRRYVSNRDLVIISCFFKIVLCVLRNFYDLCIGRPPCRSPGLGMSGGVGRHFRKRLHGAWFLTIWNFATFYPSQEWSNCRCPMDMDLYRISRLVVSVFDRYVLRVLCTKFICSRGLLRCSFRRNRQREGLRLWNGQQVSSHAFLFINLITKALPLWGRGRTHITDEIWVFLLFPLLIDCGGTCYGHDCL